MTFFLASGGFQPTYKELKQHSQRLFLRIASSFQPTYKELKHAKR